MPPSPLHAHHLFERVHHLDQFTLRCHHRVDVLVGARRLVDDALVLAALDAFRHALVVGDREAALGLAARHRAAGAVAAGVEALAVALAADDEAARAHRSGDDAEFALARADGALARDPHLGAV